MTVYAWLGRNGIARVLNTGTRPPDRGSACIEARGPRWAARHLARYALRHTSLARPFWQTVRIAGTERYGRWRWRFQFTYRQMP